MFIPQSYRLTLQRSLAVLAFCTMIILPSLSEAHSLFIQSGRFKVSTGRSTPLFFCFGHHFPVDDAVRRKKLASVKIIAPDQVTTEVALRDEKSLHSYLVEYDKPGTYTLIAITKPGNFAMYTDKKGRKRHSFKPLHTFRDNASSIEASMLSSQWAKTYVVSGEPSESFPAQIGLPLELVPDTDPTMLKEGDSVSFSVYYDGKPYVGEGAWDATFGGFSTESEDMYLPRTTIEGGKFTVPIKHSGRWFVRFFTKQDAVPEARDNYLTEKRTATLTFMVRNERRNPKPKEH